jgi:hypothetical protein
MFSGLLESNFDEGGAESIGAAFSRIALLTTSVTSGDTAWV